MQSSKEISAQVQEQLQELEFGTVEITPRDEFVQMLQNSLDKNVPLRVKCGIDPTNTDIHLGHLVPFRKMRKFQDLGHTGVVIIGDYTARIGDPSGKNESRPPLSKEVVRANAKNYMDQVYTVLDPSKTEIRYQSEWFSEVGLEDVLKWAGQTTVAKLISHETFKNRLEQNQSLGLHEFFYPMLQGMDSVYIQADVELGGTDQKFNVLMGRDYQRQVGQRPQVAMLLPLILGLDGQQKMSKSLGNYIGILDTPFDKFGKVMSIPDHLMLHYYESMAQITAEQFQHLKAQLDQQKIHPNEAKKRLATNVVALYHGEQTALEMRNQFEAVFAKGKIPDDVEEYQLIGDELLVDVLVKSGVMSSKGEVRRLIKQNAVGIVDGEKITSIDFMLTGELKEQVIKVGKRKFLKIK